MGQYFNKAGKPALINDYISYMAMKYGADIEFEWHEHLDDSTSITHVDTSVDGAINTYGWDNISKVRKLFYTNPTQASRFGITASTLAHEFVIKMPDSFRSPPTAFRSMNCAAILGHNFEDSQACFKIRIGVKIYNSNNGSWNVNYQSLHNSNNITSFANI